MPAGAKGDIAALQQAIPALESVKLVSCKNTPPQAARLLHHYEEYNRNATMKVGVVYAAPGQKTEAELLMNRDGSQCFNDFLSVLGERVELKGFTKYIGGLKATTTHESVYTTYGDKGKEIEIMFHVSTMLPYKENDPQQLDRKRHIGNDVVVVIFKESNGPDDTVDLRSFRSHFNHIFIVVTPIVPQSILSAHSASQSADLAASSTSSSSLSSSPTAAISTSAASLPSVPKLLTKYAVSVGAKGAVKPFPPYFSEKGNVFSNGDDFRNWILKKIINGERSAIESPEFRGTKMDVKADMLNSVIDELKK